MRPSVFRSLIPMKSMSYIVFARVADLIIQQMECRRINHI